MLTQKNKIIALLVAIVLVLVLVFAFEEKKVAGKDHFAPVFAPVPPASPYLQHQMQDGALRGARHDAFDQDHAYLKADLAKNFRAWATTPRDLDEAQRAAWFETTANGSNAYYNSELGGDAAAEMAHHHTPGPAINYQDALVDLIADERMRTQQANWYSEVAPKSQTALKVDTIDEAAALSNYRGHGIYTFRMDAPAQHNPLFVTDQDASSYAPHATKFTFGG